MFLQFLGGLQYIELAKGNIEFAVKKRKKEIYISNQIKAEFYLKSIHTDVDILYIHILLAAISLCNISF